MFGAPDEPVKVSRWRLSSKEVIVVIAVLVVVSLFIVFVMR